MAAGRNTRTHTRAQMPTQTLHPTRAAIRTGFQVLVALATLIPYVATQADIPVAGWFAQVVAVSVAVARIMALPGVTMFLREFFPWLAPDDGIQTPAGYDEGLRSEAKAHNDMAGG